jgi:hypothetical protein
MRNTYTTTHVRHMTYAYVMRHAAYEMRQPKWSGRSSSFPVVRLPAKSACASAAWLNLYTLCTCGFTTPCCTNSSSCCVSVRLRVGSATSVLKSEGRINRRDFSLNLRQSVRQQWELNLKR